LGCASLTRVRGGKGRSTPSCLRRRWRSVCLGGRRGCWWRRWPPSPAKDGVVEGLSTEQLCAAAGLADRTYRRARMALLSCGDVVLLSGLGGRGNTNRWQIPDPRRGEAKRRPAARRVAPPAGARPLVVPVADLSAGLPAGVDVVGRDAGGVDEIRTEVAWVKDGQDRTVAPLNRPDVTGVSDLKGGQDRTLSPLNRPDVTGVLGVKGGQDRTVAPLNRPDVTGVSGVKGGQDRTLFDQTPAQTPAETPAETPAPYARAGREHFNPRIPEHPPTPLPGAGRRLGADRGDLPQRAGSCPAPVSPRRPR
jgi:hypothetical protein